MRMEERVPLLWDIFKANRKRIIKILFGEDANVFLITKELENKDKHLLKVWRENPDLRFAQLLTNEGFLPAFNSFYFVEDERLFLMMGVCNARDILFWGNNYDKEGKYLGKTNYIPISKLETSHLENILEHNRKNGLYLSNSFLAFLEDELLLRGIDSESKRKTVIRRQNNILRDL